MIGLDRAVIEINGACNYSCNMCPQNIRDKQFKVMMPLDQFQRVVEECVEHGVKVINLDGSGEATANPNFVDYIKIVKQYGVKCVVFSNGLNMTGSMMRQAVDAGLDFFRFSLIGYNPFIYEKWMGKNKFHRIVSNIFEMQDYVTKTNAKCDVAVYSLINDPYAVQNEVEAYRKLLEPHGIKIEIWKMHNWSGVYDNDDKRKGQKRTCGRPFAPEITIRAGGINGHTLAVHPCCQVMGNDQNAVLGHLDDTSIIDVWEGEKYNKLRKGHETGDFPDYCKNCDFLLEDPEVLVYTNYGRRINKMIGTEFELEDYKK